MSYLNVTNVSHSFGGRQILENVSFKLLRGEEAIWYTPLTADCVETENKAEKEDVIFYADPQEKNCAVLNSGDFAIFFPWELHRPNCSVEKIASNVQKIVVKVKA